MLQPHIQRTDAEPPPLSDLKSRNLSGSGHSFERLPVHPQQRRGFVEAKQIFKDTNLRPRRLRFSRWCLLLKIQGCRRMCHSSLRCRTARVLRWSRTKASCLSLPPRSNWQHRPKNRETNISTASDLTEFRYGHILFSVEAAGHRRVVILLTVGEN